MSRKKVYIIGGLLVCLAAGILLFNGLSAGTMYYYTVSEFKASNQAADGSVVRVIGKVADGFNLNTSTAPVTLDFVLVEGAENLPVVYKGAVPDLFKAGNDVIVQGKYDSLKFIADSILTKCPSKYETK